MHAPGQLSLPPSFSPGRISWHHRPSPTQALTFVPFPAASWMGYFFVSASSPTCATETEATVLGASSEWDVACHFSCCQCLHGKLHPRCSSSRPPGSQCRAANPLRQPQCHQRPHHAAVVPTSHADILLPLSQTTACSIAENLQ